MNAENSHNAKTRVLEWTLPSWNTSCALLCSRKQNPIRCEVVCCSVALSFSKLGGVQRERRRTLRIIFPYRAAEVKLKIRAGYDIAFNCIQEVPMLLMLSVHPSQQQDLLSDHVIRLSPDVEARDCLDAFGNVCTRLVAPPGLIQLSNEFLISDSGLPDEINNHAEQWPVGDLPDEALPYLLGSRYCDTQKLSDQAWAMFGGITGGWQRVQAICDYVHDRIEFGYHHARCDRTASSNFEVITSEGIKEAEDALGSTTATAA